MKRQLPLCWALIALALPAALPAAALAAAEGHPFLGVVGSAAYEDACGVAYGPGGLYVADYHHDQIDLPGGGKIENVDPTGGPCKLAFDSEGDLYVYDYHHDVVRYEAGHLKTGAGEVIDSAPPGGREAPTGLSVDQAGGDLYVAHRTYIARYAAPVHAGEAPSAIVGEDEGAAYYGLGFSNFPGAGAQPSTEGDLYVPDAATETVKVFDSSGAPIGEIDGEATPQGAFRDLVDSEAIVDENPVSPSYGHLYVLDRVGFDESGSPEGVFDEFNSAGAYRGQLKGFTDAGPSGIAVEAPIGNVYVTSGDTEDSALFKYGPTAPAHTLEVAKTGTGGGTVASSPAGIDCGGACEAEFDEGGKVELFASPDGHSVFKGWSGGGCTGAGTCTVLISVDADVSAEFEEPAQRTLTVEHAGAGAGMVSSEPAGISCASGTCAEHFALGRLVTLTATPAPHSRFAEWLGVACDESTQRTCQVTMSQAQSLSARFEPIPQVSLSVTRTGAGEGTVDSSPAGLSCPGTCSASFDEGSKVTLTAIPAPTATFAGWSGGGCSGSAAFCTVTMAEAKAVSGEFDPILAPADPPAQAFAPSAPATAQAPTASAPASTASAPQMHKPKHRKKKRHHHPKRRRRHR